LISLLREYPLLDYEIGNKSGTFEIDAKMLEPFHIKGSDYIAEPGIWALWLLYFVTIFLPQITPKTPILLI